MVFGWGVKETLLDGLKKIVLQLMEGGAYVYAAVRVQV